jgi:DNA repair exonuclease SbcCD ATPase subunit
MIITKYKNFIGEALTILQTDSPSVATTIHKFNDLEKFINEFNTKRTVLRNIYLTYDGEDDLINKLSSQNFIEKTTNKKEIKFENPLLQMYSQVCDKIRRVEQIKKDVDNSNSNIKDKQQFISDNPSSKEENTEDIKSIQTQISDKNKDIQELNQEIVRLERQTNEKLKQMSKELVDTKKEIQNIKR